MKIKIQTMYNKICREVAWFLPKRIVMWCYYRIGAHVTSGKYGDTHVADLTMMDAIKRWSKDNGI